MEAIYSIFFKMFEKECQLKKYYIEEMRRCEYEDGNIVPCPGFPDEYKGFWIR
jgi:hypothetical protein